MSTEAKNFSLQSIRLSGDDIEIVDQLLLPHEVKYVPIDTIEQAHDAIKTMKVGKAMHT